MPSPFPVALGWKSGQTPISTSPIAVDPQIPPNTYIVSLFVLPLHIYDNDPHPEPWDGLTVSTSEDLTTFSITLSGGPRDSIQFFMWQVTYAYYA